MTSNIKQPRNLLPSRAYAADLLLGEGFRGFFITPMTDEERKEKRRVYYAKNKEKIKAASAKWYLENTERKKAKRRTVNKEKRRSTEKAYYAVNKEKIKDTKAAWRKANLEKFKASQAAYYAANKEKRKISATAWRKANPEKGKATRAAYQRQRRVKDPFFAMSSRLRARLNKAFKNGGFKKQSTTEKMLGCTFKQFTKHIESQFTDGMSWDNRGEWHLDHIVPLSCATTIEGLEKLSHYTNIRPLWAADNRAKSNNLVLI